MEKADLMNNSPWQEVLDFWKAAGAEKWFTKDDEFDSEMKQKFLSMHADAHSGKLDSWAENPDACLALIIVLDQFSRNMFRDDPKAFASDPKALSLSKTAIASGFAEKVDQELRFFLFMPLMHSESLDDQKESLALQLTTKSEGSIRAARQHLEIIEKYGRFPHRNKVLGRQTTPQEEAYLDQGGFKG